MKTEFIHSLTAGIKPNPMRPIYSIRHGAIHAYII